MKTINRQTFDKPQAREAPRTLGPEKEEPWTVGTRGRPQPWPLAPGPRPGFQSKLSATGPLPWRLLPGAADAGAHPVFLGSPRRPGRQARPRVLGTAAAVSPARSQLRGRPARAQPRGAVKAPGPSTRLLPREPAAAASGYS